MKAALQAQPSLDVRVSPPEGAPGGAQTTINPKIWGLGAEQGQQLTAGCSQRNFGAGGIGRVGNIPIQGLQGSPGSSQEPPAYSSWSME